MTLALTSGKVEARRNEKRYILGIGLALAKMEEARAARSVVQMQDEDKSNCNQAARAVTALIAADGVRSTSSVIRHPLGRRTTFRETCPRRTD